MSKFLKKYMTLKVRIPTLFLFSLLFLATCIVSISFRRYEKLNVDKHFNMAGGITTLMAEKFDADKVEYYMENNYSSEEYRDILKYYYTLKDSYPDVRYMYVYRLFMDSEENHLKGKVIIDLDEEYTEDVPQDSIDLIGSIVPTSEEFDADYEKMIIEGECVMHIVASEDGKDQLISYVRPIFDKDGNYVCSAGVDFSKNEIYGKGIDFVVELLVVIASIIIAVIVIMNILLAAILFKPIDQMTKCIEAFRFDTDQDRFNNVSNLEALNIHVENEIDGLYNALVMSMKDSAYYMSNFNRAKTEIQEISETAYKDALTGVGSKTAYNMNIEKIQRDMNSEKGLRYAVVMIDINNLKYVNDTYGHELGDDYIRGCCSIICKVYKRSPVFRIGGDEFVVILTGDDFVSRMECFDNMEDEFDAAFSDESVEPYNRYSASFGMAEYKAGSDRTFYDVFKRADSSMYEFKKEFKKIHGSYR